jgi:hypothetical protein
MNFDELKDAWAKEPVPGAALPANVAEKTGSAVLRIRRSMRLEFTWLIVAYAAALVFVLFFGQARLSFLVVCCGSFLLVQLGYYIFRFLLFYRRAGRYDMGLRKHLRRFTYELEVNMEIYRVYSFCVVPTGCLLVIALMDASGRASFLIPLFCGEGLSRPGLFGILSVLVLLQVVGAAFLRSHMRRHYGRHLLELKRVVAELEDDQD